MGSTVPVVGVELQANAQNYEATLLRARDSANKTAYALVNMGGAFGKPGEILESGLRSSSREVLHLAGAFGVAGGEGTRFALSATQMLLGGINPLALGVVGLGVGVMALVEHFKDSNREAEEHSKALQKLADEGVRKYEESLLKLRAASHGVSEDEQKAAESSTEHARLAEAAGKKEAAALAAIAEAERVLADPETSPTERARIAGSMEHARAEVARLATARIKEELLAQKDLATVRNNEEATLPAAIKELGERTAAQSRAALAVGEDAKAMASLNAEFDGFIAKHKGMNEEQKAEVDRIRASAVATLDLTSAIRTYHEQQTEKFGGDNEEFNAASQRLLAEIEDVGKLRKAWLGAQDAKKEVYAYEPYRNPLGTSQTLGIWSPDDHDAWVERGKRMTQLQSALSDLEQVGQTDRLKIIDDAAAKESAALDAHFHDLLEAMKTNGEDQTSLVQGIETAKAKIRAAAEREKALVGDDFGAGFAAEAAKAREEMAGLGAAGAQVYDGLRQGFGDVFVGVAHNAKSAEQVILSMLGNIEDRLLRIASDQAFQALFGKVRASLFSAPTSAPGATPTSAGVGNIDYTSFGGPVGASKRAVLGGGTKIEVHNYSGEKAAVDTRRAPNGDEIHRIVIGSAMKDLAQNGEFTRALQDRFGLSRAGARRG